jgi:SpoVK/Ycf46/Vps4 family AAA+-type ATPase
VGHDGIHELLGRADVVAPAVTGLKQHGRILLDVAEKLKERMGRRTSEEKSPMQVPASGGSDAPSFAVSTVKGIRMADVIGLDDAKQVVSDALINPIRHPDIYKILKVKPGTGLLLYGPPRTGKTMFARAVASEMDCAFIHVKSSALKSKYVGETEKNLEKCFREAAASGALLLFDEADSIFSKRTEL